MAPAVAGVATMRLVPAASVVPALTVVAAVVAAAAPPWAAPADAVAIMMETAVAPVVLPAAVPEHLVEPEKAVLTAAVVAEAAAAALDLWGVRYPLEERLVAKVERAAMAAATSFTTAAEVVVAAPAVLARS